MHIKVNLGVFVISKGQLKNQYLYKPVFAWQILTYFFSQGFKKGLKVGRKNNTIYNGTENSIAAEMLYTYFSNIELQLLGIEFETFVS